MKMEPENRLAEIFTLMGIATIKPTEGQLVKWGMSMTRFNQLVANEGRVNIQVQEARLLREWLREHFALRHHAFFEDEVTAVQRAQLAGKQEQLQLS